MDKKLSFLVIVFFLVLALFSTIVIKKNNTVVKAANQTPDATKSFVIVSSKGSDCSISAVVRDAAEKAIANKEVCFTSSVGQLASQCAVTDDSGIAQVTASSTTAGTGQITANITGLFEIATKGSCNFTL